MSHRAFVALGSNLEDPQQQVLRALAELDGLPGTRVTAKSALYRTAPVGYDNQPDFINAAAEVSTTLEPLALLRALLALETAHGRERPFPNAPRVLDLDLLLYDDLELHDPELTLPHPRLHERGFVLFPLADIAPELHVPGKAKVRDLLLVLPDQGVERMAA
ncbi:2-amino-4-hydroxy-6-hydroxymethyldihydropteridine diphosphokinase [Methylobacillus sp. MM3]|uniref:2-amino-4-hydroxy-6- hydroxymethyldihydropteridine diphosphokinase n=1 Tax=Methylobacillus sp. MM3 TaxID=1848039 RepID=UPI0007DF83D5|nr:2-amino-4-hydroxy-6-hydroxymethyldihydropteridine diphosphokinase [Methylobacillus sp. MM3]OAJ69598.1 2-amino-4-hydroxy-6-hydroxymethyldihydropteridine diphosphokinase [Methylobacillus sp. MM3]